MVNALTFRGLMPAASMALPQVLAQTMEHKEMTSPELQIAQHLIDKHFVIWNDPQPRISSFGEVYTGDFYVADYADIATGYPQVVALIARVQREHPGFVFHPAPVTWNHGLGRVTWSYGPQNDSGLVHGEDIFTVRDGRIASIHVFINQP
ncbi:hypothetical protein SAMN05216168_5256 [Kosakonia radicincitans]|uniref:nuclear transport factor 2 family protein n=1 Tax=Kosakonia TaxID=1330547 RepID=UPI0009C37850|nr:MULTISPECIES: nuclear transport factor 2 family protein [Kosakonia]SKC23308.1 hypothetical protein SAMN05216168_5256 [Kosakonia radicincitans]